MSKAIVSALLFVLVGLVPAATSEPVCVPAVDPVVEEDVCTPVDPDSLPGLDAIPTDGFVAKITFPGGTETPVATSVVADADGNVVVDVVAYQGGAPYANEPIWLKVAMGTGVLDGGDGTPAPVCPVGASSATVACVLQQQATTDADGAASFAFAASDLQADRPANGLDFFAMKGASGVSSHYLVAKNLLIDQAIALADPAGHDALFKAADVLDEAGADAQFKLTTPVFIGTPPAPVAPADGLVGTFAFASAGSSPGAVPQISLTDDGVDVLVQAQRSSGTGYGPATGPLTLYAQLDCGALRDAIGPQVPCQPWSETLAAHTLQDGDGGAYAFHLDADDLRAGFLPGLPVAALHFFVQADAQYSHYLTGNDAVVTQDAALADQLEEGAFSPVLLFDDRALPVGDGLVGAFRFAAGGEAPADAPQVTLTADGVDVTVDAYRLVDGSYDPASGPLTLFAQLDCGGLKDALGSNVPCQEPMQTLAQDTDEGVGGLYSFHLEADDLRAGLVPDLPLTALHFFVQAGDQYSHHLAGKDLATHTSRAGADLVEEATFSPVLLIDGDATPSAGDGMVARIVPRNSFRTPFGSIMELDAAGQAAFDVCAYGPEGEAHGFTDFRLELGGLPRGEPEPDAETLVIVAAGTYNLPEHGIEVSPNNGDNCHTIRFAGGALVSGETRAHNMFRVTLWLPFSTTGLKAEYSETVNGMTGTGGLLEGYFAVADEIDGVSSSAVHVVPRRMNPLGAGDASTEVLLRDPSEFALAVLGAVLTPLGGLPAGCPPSDPLEAAACVPPGTVPDECPPEAPGTFPACQPAVPPVGPPPAVCELPEAGPVICDEASGSGEPQGLNGVPGWLQPFAKASQDAKAVLSDLFPWFG